MVCRNEIRAVADAMEGEGLVPTVRGVTARLLNGGSPNNVGPLLNEWAEERRNGVVPEAVMPARVSERTQALVTQLWGACYAQARRSLEAEAAGLRQSDGYRQALVAELSAELEGRGELVRVLERELAETRALLAAERSERRAAEERATAAEIRAITLAAKAGADPEAAGPSPTGEPAQDGPPASQDLDGEGSRLDQAKRVILGILARTAPDPVTGAALNRAVVASGLKLDRGEAAKKRLKDAGEVHHDPVARTWTLPPGATAARRSDGAVATPSGEDGPSRIRQAS